MSEITGPSIAFVNATARVYGEVVENDLGYVVMWVATDHRKGTGMTLLLRCPMPYASGMKPGSFAAFPLAVPWRPVGTRTAMSRIIKKPSTAIVHEWKPISY